MYPIHLRKLHETVNFRPWLIFPQAHESLRVMLDGFMAHGVHSAESKRPKYDHWGDSMPSMQIENGIATIPIYGVLGKGLGEFEKGFGMTSLDDIENELDQAMTDETVRGILLDVNSPGGSIGGIPELADKIERANEVKPIIAYSEGQMASAAYWLSAGANYIYASRSSELGSIGVYLPFVDRSAMFAANGVKVEVIKNRGGDYKAAGFPGTSLTDDQREKLQEGVDGIFAMFVNHVMTNRPAVSKDALRGQTFLGQEAHGAGLSDYISTRGEALADLGLLVDMKR